MDLMMNRIDGVDFISVLQNEPDAPILIVSAHLTNQTRADMEATWEVLWPQLRAERTPARQDVDTQVPAVGGDTSIYSANTIPVVLETSAGILAAYR
jgi:CheY-like chemotaxis protein